MGDRQEKAKTEGIDRLRRRLPSAPADYLIAALDNPTLGPDEIVLLLRNRQAPPSALRRIAARTDWTAQRDVRGMLALHPRSPLALARRFLPHLTWVELVEAARDVRVNPSVRRDAERILVVRLPELAVGERVSLARRASGRVAGALLEDADPAVLRALLENPRTSEAAAARLAGSVSTPPPVLDHLSRDPRWSLRPSVRRRLLRNRSTPAPALLKLVSRAPRTELSALSRDEEAPGLARIAAARRLEGRAEPDRETG